MDLPTDMYIPILIPILILTLILILILLIRVGEGRADGGESHVLLSCGQWMPSPRRWRASLDTGPGGGHDRQTWSRTMI